MKILHVVPAIAPGYGGPSVATRHLATTLASRGVDVHVLTTTAAGSHELNIPVGVPVTENGVTYFYFPRQWPRGWIFSWPLSRWLLSHVQDYELLHVHAVFSFPSSFASWIARRRNVPYIVRPLGTLDPWPMSRGKWKKIPYYWLLERSNLKGAAALHATSERNRTAIAQLGLQVPVVEIPLSVELPIDDGPTMEARRGSADDAITLLFLGRLHPVKGLDVLLESLILLPNREQVRLVIAGAGEHGYVRQLKDKVQSLGLLENVAFTGFVNGDAKNSLLRGADIFVLPSFHENFGLAVAEAMAAGLPVIVTDRVGLAPDVQESSAGLVVRSDPRELAQAIGRLWDDRAFRLHLGRNARRLAQRKFSSEPVAQRLIALYAEVSRRSATLGE